MAAAAAAAARNKVTFYFDCVSPWSFVGYTMLRRYQKAWNLDITYAPMNLGYIMKFAGNRPPISVPNKGAYMVTEMVRCEKFFGVKVAMPAAFPINTQTMQIVLFDMAERQDAKLEHSIETCFRAIWERDAPCATAEDMVAILTPALGADTAAVVKRALENPETKKKLTQVTKELVDDGVFGSPWFVITRAVDGDKAAFFGSDRFEQMAAWLNVPYKGPFADGITPKL